MRIHLLIPALLTCLMAPLPSQAVAGMACDVQFLVNAKWSEPRTMTVQFMTGTELNTASNGFDFVPFKSYAVIPSGITDRAIVELDAPKTSAGSAFTEDDLKALFAMRHLLVGWQVNGKAMVKWSIEPQWASRRSRP